MRRTFLGCLILLLSAEAAYAQAKAGRIDTHVWGGGRSLSAPQPEQDKPVPPPNGPPNRPPSGGHGGHDHDHRWRRRPHWNNGPGWNWGWSPYVVAPWFNEFGYTYTFPYPQAGVEAPAAQPLDWLAPAPDPVAAPAPAADLTPPGRISSPDQKARAGRYLTYGDNLFAKQKYLAALGRYKSATDAASDMAEAYLRQGFAYVAMGHYQNAAKAFRRGLAIRPNWQGSGFRLATLYGGVDAAKSQDIDKLALAVEENPFDSGLLMTLGLMLYFDGQFDRAELCFQNAARLGGSDEPLLADFLRNADPGAVPAKPRKVSF